VRLYSYIVKHDGGFAPNPFFGYCTVACCKPQIRKRAKEGDWIIGLSPRASGNKVVFYMEVEESLGFHEYWRDPRFQTKKPTLNGGRAAAHGDNISKPSKAHGHGYLQIRSVHSGPIPFGRSENAETKNRDLAGERVLVSTSFAYFGKKSEPLPPDLRDLVVARGYKCKFPDRTLEIFRHFVSQREAGVLGPPSDWKDDDGSWRQRSCIG
jgi:Nucleotide modification associated domain 2